jgi:hypothetical protein
VAQVSTTVNGSVAAVVKGVSTAVDTSTVTLTPLASAGTPAVYAGTSQALFGWRCGSTTDGTSANIGKYLPGSCRG